LNNQLLPLPALSSAKQDRGFTLPNDLIGSNSLVRQIGHVRSGSITSFLPCAIHSGLPLSTDVADRSGWSERCHKQSLRALLPGRSRNLPAGDQLGNILKADLSIVQKTSFGEDANSMGLGSRMSRTPGIGSRSGSICEMNPRIAPICRATAEGQVSGPKALACFSLGRGFAENR
jgi:hypothetical protein